MRLLDLCEVQPYGSIGIKDLLIAYKRVYARERV